MRRSRGQSPGEADPARASFESVSDDTTADCHPIVLDDKEDETERLVGKDASRSGLVPKPAPGVREVALTQVDIETETETRKAVDRADYERELSETVTAVPGDISGALETVPLSAALVQHVIAKVDARHAAQAPVVAPAPIAVAPPMPPPAALVEPPRRVGVEIAIGFVTFLAVAVPALYYLYVSR